MAGSFCQARDKLEFQHCSYLQVMGFLSGRSAAPYSFRHIVGRPSKTVWKGFSSRQGMFTLWVGWYGFNAGRLGGICV